MNPSLAYEITKPATLCASSGVINGQLLGSLGLTIDVWGFPEQGHTLDDVDAEMRTIIALPALLEVGKAYLAAKGSS